MERVFKFKSKQNTALRNAEGWIGGLPNIRWTTPYQRTVKELEDYKTYEELV